MKTDETYREFEIERATTVLGPRYIAAHKNYDGPGDNRIRGGETLAEIYEEVDMYWEEQEGC